MIAGTFTLGQSDTRAARKDEDRGAAAILRAMLDHMGIGVSDLEASRHFFLHALAPFGFRQIMEGDRAVAFGRGEYPEFWIDAKYRSLHVHLAFKANNRAQVDEFFRRALAAGGKDNGAPGIRAHYHPDYYAAFVVGPDGHNIEAVCRRRED